MTADLDIARYRYRVFVNGVRDLLTHFRGGSITSWLRSPARNLEKKGQLGSQHLAWTAVDVVWDQGAAPDVGHLTAVARELGLEVIREADHDHLELATNLD